MPYRFARTACAAVVLIAACLLFGAAPLRAQSPGDQTKHIVNGDFEKNITGWNAFDFIEGDDGKPANVTTNDAVLKRVTPDDGENMTAEDSDGAVRVTVEDFQGPTTSEHSARGSFNPGATPFVRQPWFRSVVRGWGRSQGSPRRR